MQLYVLDRAKNTLATTASFYNDKHHKELTAGASTFEFTVDKTDDAAQYMSSGNYIVYQDDRGRVWSFTILDYDETQTTRTVFAEDVSIELLNKAMDVWNTTEAHPFSYYFDLVTKDTPWKLGVNQLTDLSRKLVYTGRDTGLGRLLSILKGFDNAECQFNVTVQQNKPVAFIVDVYKSIGTVQDNIQIVYNNELSDIKKTESRAQFVTALAGVGGLVENQATTDPGLEKHIDFADIDYKDDNFISPKGDKFLRAVTANKTFNPGTTSYIEDFYDYDTQSAQELLNRTLTQLKERSEPQYTYEADVKVIDPTLDIGDTVTIIDHDYNPALYLQARVATLDKSYTDPTQGSITFCNYRVLNSTLSDQLRAMQNIIDKLPTSASVKLINSNIMTLITQNEDLKKQVNLALKSADGKNINYYGPDKPIQPNAGDIWFKQNGDKQIMMIYRDGQWHELASDMTGEEIKAKVGEAFANDEALQKRVEDNDTKIADNIKKADAAVSTANQAVSAAGFANNQAESAKQDAANAVTQASTAYNAATSAQGAAKSAVSNAQSALSAATSATATTKALSSTVDDINGTIKNLATTETVDKLTGTVSSAQALAKLAADGLEIKADKTTVETLKGSVEKNTASIKTNADSISAKVTASDVTGMLGNYATQSWSEGKISAAKNEISASVETVKQTVDNLQVNSRNLARGTQNWNGETFYYLGVRVLDEVFMGTQIANDSGNIWQDARYAIADLINRGLVIGNQDYTLSVWCRLKLIDETTTDYAKAEVMFYGENTSMTGTTMINDLDTSWRRVSITFRFTGSPQTGHLRFERPSADGLTYFQQAGFTLNLGNKDLGWQPAPEDQATIDWTKAQLDIKDGKISAAMTSLKSDITNATAGMATQTWTQGRLDLTASGLKSEISSVTNQLNNTSSRNLLRNTVFNGATYWEHIAGNQQPSVDTVNKYNNNNSLKITATGVGGGTTGFINQGFLGTWATGNQFTITFYAKLLSGSPQLHTELNGGRGAINIPLTAEWQRYSVTLTYNDAALFYLWATGAGEILINSPMLVSGLVPMQWSPAPEDQATVADVSSQFTQLQNDINLRVKTGDFASAVLNINDMISARVTNDDFHGAMLSMSDKIDLQVYNAKNGNLLRNSEFITDKYWTSTGNHSFWPFEPKKSSINVPSVLIIAAGAGAKTGGQLTTEFKADGLTKYDKVTLSFYAQGTAGTQLTFTLNGTTLDTYAVTLTATRTYYTLTLVYDTGNKLSIFADRADNTIYVDSLMLAKGATAMPWEPAGDNILTRIYMDDSDVLIQGKHIHLDGETTIDNAIIKSAMIDTVSANKLTAGTIDASNINVIHINGQNITANSITADKLAADAIQVGLNNLGSVIQLNPTSLDFYNSGQRSMSLQKDGMHIIDYLNGEDVGLIHVNRMEGHDNVNGLEFDLNKNGDYMAWGQRSDDTSLYDTKFIWRSAYAASVSTGFQGFEFTDDVKVAFNKTLHVHTIDPTDIWPEINVNDTLNVNGDLKVDSKYTVYLSKIGTNYTEHRYIQFSNTDVGNIPGVLIGSTSGHGILIGDDAIYLVFSGGTYNMWDIIHSIGRNQTWS